MNDDNLVSIVMPFFNASKTVSRSIKSVIEQSYENWELLVVNDYSKPEQTNYLKDIIKTFNDERIRLIELDVNVGAAEARNVAISTSKGRYLAFLDSDDFWSKEKLKKQLTFMKEKNSAFTFSAYNVISEDGEDILGRISVPSKITYSQYLGNTIIGCLTVILDVSKLGKVTMPNLRSSHDMALWADILKRIDFADGLNEELSTYRLVKSSNTANKLKASKEVWQVYRNYLKLNVFLSSYYFIQYAFNAVKKRVIQ